MTNDYYQPSGASVNTNVSTGQGAPADDQSETVDEAMTPQAPQETPQISTDPPVVPPAPQEEEVSGDDGSAIMKNLTETIVRDLGFEGASEEQKQKTLESINRRVMTAVLKAIITNSSPEVALEISEKIASDTVGEADIEKVLKDSPDLMTHIHSEVGLLHERMLEESKQAWNLAKAQEQEPKQNESVPQEQPNPPVPADQAQAMPEQDSEQVPEPVQAESNEDVIRKIIDDLKGQGRVVDQNSLAAAIYQARTDGKIIPDISVEGQDDQTRGKMLSDWDWYKAAGALTSSPTDQPQQ